MTPMRVVILTADTGGGHRSVSEALVEAFQEIGQNDVMMMDVFKYVPPPWNQIPKFYLPTINRASRAWSASYRLFNTRAAGSVYMRGLIDPLTRFGMRRLYRERQPSLVISTHPLFQFVPAKILHKQLPGVPFVTMVTDFASAHRWWFTPETELCLLPSEELRPLALAHGVAAKNIYVTGLPVHRAFSLNRYVTRQEARAALGVADRTTLLLVGGGEGMGALEAMALAVERELPEMQMLIVAGRNQKLLEKLSARQWVGPTHVYGFVRNMPQLMRAADVIVTKAGPSTLSEALICGLPILLSGFVPGQEEGNVKFVLDHKTGHILETPETDLAPALQQMMANDGAGLAELAQNAYALGKPDAAREAVRLVMQLYQVASAK